MSFDSPGPVIGRLEEIDQALAVKQNALEQAALAWFRVKRDKDHARAVAFLKAQGTVAERSAQADVETVLMGKEEEALWEALRAVVKTLGDRASIGQSILRAQGRS